MKAAYLTFWLLLHLGDAARDVLNTRRVLKTWPSGPSSLLQKEEHRTINKATTYLSEMKVGQRFRVETDLGGWEFATLRSIHPKYLLQFDDGETMLVPEPRRVPIRPSRHLAAHAHAMHASSLAESRTRRERNASQPEQEQLQREEDGLVQSQIQQLDKADATEESPNSETSEETEKGSNGEEEDLPLASDSTDPTGR